MKKLFWFGVGVLLALVAALAAAEGFNPKTATVAQTMREIDDENRDVISWVTGLTQGAYMAYINKLVDDGLKGEVAVAVAESNCGQITPQTVLFGAYGSSRMRNLPVVHAVPALVWAFCTKGETGS